MTKDQFLQQFYVQISSSQRCTAFVHPINSEQDWKKVFVAFSENLNFNCTFWEELRAVAKEISISMIFLRQIIKRQVIQILKK